MPTLETAIWWTGAGILTAGAALAAALIIAVVSIVAVWVGGHYAARLIRMPLNMVIIHQWVKAGKPVWTEVEGHRWEMRPMKEKGP
jgi:hypothetical protein